MHLTLKSIAIVGSLLLAAPSSAETATLKMRFVFDGIPPVAKQINVAPAFAPVGGPVIDETLLVASKSKGIRNVIVQIYTGRGGSTLDLPPHQGEKRRMTMANARFEPHVLLAQAGDTLELIDLGPNQHNPNISFFKNLPHGITIPPNKSQLIRIAHAEPAPMPIVCNLHPWMRAYVVVLDHPFAAVSDSDGSVVIDDLPANTNLVFRVFHEAGRIDHVHIDGVPTAWDRSRFNVDLKAGDNDLGDILVPEKSLGF